TSNQALGTESSAFGSFSIAGQDYSTAIGYAARALGYQSNAFGAQAHAAGDYSMAIGFQATADEEGVVSFGHSAGAVDYWGGTYATDRNARLVHVAAGIDATDAVNLGQMWAADTVLGNGLAAFFGAGASYSGGVFGAP